MTEYVLINSIEDYPEDFLFAKVDVEKKMIEDGKIEKRMKLDDFILSLNIQDNIFMKNQKSIAFSIREGLDNLYVFYSFLDNEVNEELFEDFKKRLEKMKFNVVPEKLTKPEPMQLLESDVTSGELFMLHFEIFI